MRAEIVLGPPGTGKTTTLIRMVEEELERGTPPDRIGYVSFTRRAAEEAVRRACERFSLERKDLPFFRTLHSLCFKFLGISSSEILEGKRMEEFGELVGHKITGRFSLDEGTVFGFEKGDRLVFIENLARVRQVPLRELYNDDDDQLSWMEVDRFARTLAQYKIDTGLMDYTDLLQQFVATEVGPRLDALFVDEAQDLSILQWEVVRKLAAQCNRVVIAGDDDQAIYRWAGADVETLVQMEGDVRVLHQSWRVPRAVQEVASRVVSRIHHRRSKEWSPRDAEGEVKWISLSSVDLSGPDILVLGRNRWVLREFEHSIRDHGYLYEFQGMRSIRPMTLDAVLTWERLRKGRPNVLAQDVRRMYDLMSMNKGWKRGHRQLPAFQDEEPVSWEDLVDRGGLLVPKDRLWYNALDKLSGRDETYIRAALRRGEDLLAPPRIRLSTIHGMKGGEATRVILLTEMAARTVYEARRSPEDEARVWYVAITRAKEQLHIVQPTISRYYKI